MPLVQQSIREHFGQPPRKGVHPDECVALGAALLGDSLDSIDAVTLVDVLSMPIGIAAPERADSRRVLEKNRLIPATRSFRLPPPREPGKPIEIDIYQGDGDQIVDDEFLGSLRLPAAATGRRIDFKLDEECLLQVSFDDPERGHASRCPSPPATRPRRCGAPWSARPSPPVPMRPPYAAAEGSLAGCGGPRDLPVFELGDCGGRGRQPAPRAAAGALRDAEGPGGGGRGRPAGLHPALSRSTVATSGAR